MMFRRFLTLLFLAFQLKSPLSLASGADTSTIEDELVQETINAGRGERDEPGVRDQWASSDHLGTNSKYNMRLSTRVQDLLNRYQLTCDGCTEQHAVAKINAFVKDAKEQAERDAQRESWLERAAGLVTLVALGAGAYLYNNRYTLGGGGMSEARRQELDQKRRLHAKKQEEAFKMAAKEAPTWRENEEQEVWTAQQEKQFQKALRSFGGVPPKARYTLIADKVDDKNRQECLLHHKLLQLIAKEEKQEKEQGGKEQ